mgnify:CR=1 FL=1
MSVEGNRPERPKRALGQSYYTEWVGMAKEVGGFTGVSAIQRGPGKRVAREDGAAHDCKKTAAQRLSTTGKICYGETMNRLNVLDNFRDPFGTLFTPEVAQRVAAFRVDDTTQARLDTLADKCTEGQLTAAKAKNMTPL